jgi:hypothetical protein
MHTGANEVILGDAGMAQWIAMEHYRMHTVEHWPDGPYKRATVNAIHASLNRLTEGAPRTDALACSICSQRKLRETLAHLA